jgi:hypothetical protein
MGEVVLLLLTIATSRVYQRDTLHLLSLSLLREHTPVIYLLVAR